MAFTFPTSPASGDTFKHGGLEFVYRDSPNRWATNGYPGPTPDPFADFLLTTYAGAASLSTNHIAIFDEQPFAPPGTGIADETTGGVIALSDINGQGNGILFPTTIVGPTGLMGNAVSEFDATTQMKVYDADGDVFQGNISSTRQASGGSFGLGGRNSSQSAGVGMGFGGIPDAQIKSVTRIDFRIPAGGTGTEGNVFAILVDPTVVTVLTSSGSGNNGGSTNYHNYRYGELNEVFVPA